MKEPDMSRTARGGGYAVQTAGLARRFGGRTAVDRVDLLVPAGTAFGYLGPDGAGKTTLIRMLPGLTAATSGSVRVLGHPVPAGRSAALLRVGAMAGEPRFLRPTSRIQMQRLGPSSRPATTGRVPAVFGSVRDSRSAPAPAGPSGCLSVTSPGIISCISRAISAQDEADGLPAVRFFRCGRSRVSGLFGGSLYPGLVMGAAFCCCTKSNAKAPAWAAYAESTSGRRS
jgi:energy-coupling factor transporter ATP-binding protein EcfA2